MATKSTNPLDAAAIPTPAVIEREFATIDRERTVANQSDLKKEELILLSMAPQYANHFGDIMTVTLNGLTIYFPVNGQSYRIPKSYAMVVQQRRRMADDLLMRRGRLADVTRNREDYAGGLELVPR